MRLRYLFVLFAIALLGTTRTWGQVVIVSQVGDQDGFGIGISCGDYFDTMAAFTPDSGDPLGTDQETIFRGYLGEIPIPEFPELDLVFPPVPLVHEYSPIPAESILSATLELCTADIDDGVSQHSDLQLFLDGVEIPGAFDGMTNQWVSGLAGYSGVVTFEIPPSHFGALADGNLEVLIDDETNESQVIFYTEGWGVDYSLLRITVGASFVSCVGFQPPMASGTVTARGNRALPLKAQLFDGDGLEVDDLGFTAPPVLQVMFQAAGSTGAVDVTDDALPAGFGTEGNEFEYNPADGVWQYNLKTKDHTAVGTYTITMVSGDNSEYVIDPTCEATFERE